MSEIVAAVVREQLKGYPSHLTLIREAVLEFKNFIGKFQGLELMLGTGSSPSESSFTQVVLKINDKSKISKEILWKGLAESGVPIWHANFELINTLSFFRKGTWKNWILKGDIERIETNYQLQFSHAQQLYDKCGIGLAKMNFLSRGNIEHLRNTLEKIYRK